MEENLEDPLIQTLENYGVISREKCSAIMKGKSRTHRNFNLCMGSFLLECEKYKWMEAITEKLLNFHFILQRQTTGESTGTIPDFHYIPTPGKENGERILHEGERKINLMRTGKEPTEQEIQLSVLGKPDSSRSRELCWIIPYRNNRGTRKLIFLLTFDPHHLLKLRMQQEEMEKAKAYWEKLAIEQEKINPKDNPKPLFLTAITGIHEWTEAFFPPEGKEKPEWERHNIEKSEREKGAIAGMDIYYSNSLVVYGWSTLEKPKGRERSRVHLQQLLSKKVVLFDPIYGKSTGEYSKSIQYKKQVVKVEETEKEITAKAIWESAVLQAYRGASDIHLEPQEDEGKKETKLVVSLRKDNEVTFYAKCPPGVGENVVRYALESSGVIRSDTDHGQDGRKSWTHPTEGKTIDMRISVTPMKAGGMQEVVIRLLDNSRLKSGLVELDIEPEELEIWRRALSLEESLILISGPTGSGKCLSGDSLITTSLGTLPIREVHTKFQKAKPLRNIRPIKAFTEDGIQPIKETHYLGRHHVLNLTLSNGMILEPRKTHRFRVLTPNLEIIWKTAGDLQPLDQLIHIGEIQGKTKKSFRKTDAYLQGVLCGDSCLPSQKFERKRTKKHARRYGADDYPRTGIHLTAEIDCIQNAPDYLKTTAKLFRKKFGKGFWRISWVKKDKRPILVMTTGNTKEARKILKENWIQKENSYEKSIPTWILQGDWQEQIQFLAGLTDTNGHIDEGGIKITLQHEKIIRDCQHILAGMGIQSTVRPKPHRNKKTYWTLAIPRKTSILKLKDLGFYLQQNYKRTKLQKEWEEDIKNPFNPKVTWKISKETWRKIYQEAKKSGNHPEKHPNLFGQLYREKSGITLETLSRTAKLFPSIIKKWPAISYLLERHAEPVFVKFIKPGKISDCYDLEMEGSPSYTVGGIMGHNSSSLFSAVCDIYNRDPKRKITSIEDPIEYTFPFRATQHEVKESTGMTFPAYIRRMMRNDVDTVLVGEIRDKETLFAALQLGLTGHQILSTIHAKSAADTILRMLEFKPEPYIVSEVTKLVVAQRLAATPCPVCSRTMNSSEAEAEIQRKGGLSRVLGYIDRWKRKHPHIGEGRWKKADGCPSCKFTGVQGKTALQEFLIINDGNKKYLKEGNVGALQQSMQERDLFTLETTAWKLAWMGKIPIIEAGRLTNTLEENSR